MRTIAIVWFAMTVMVGAGTVDAQSNDARSNPASGMGGHGPCGGASAPSQEIQVHVVGRQARSSLKVIGHFQSDRSGMVTGELIVGSGADRVEVRRFCRIWIGGQHDADGDIVHVLGSIDDPVSGERFVRVDLRGTDGSVRVRTRFAGHASGHSMADEGVEHGGGWSSLTGEGWLKATRIRHRTTME